MNRGTFNLGKYDIAQMMIEGKNILLCGTSMAFDDYIEDEVMEVFRRIHTDLLDIDASDIEELYMVAVKEISHQIIQTVEEANNFEVKYQYQEY